MPLNLETNSCFVDISKVELAVWEGDVVQHTVSEMKLGTASPKSSMTFQGQMYLSGFDGIMQRSVEPDAKVGG